MAELNEPDPRVYFAAERTFLAWIRTGLALMGFGFVVARFGLFLREVSAVRATEAATPSYSHWVGVGLIALGVALTAGTTSMHVATIRRLNRGEPFVGRPTGLGIAIAAVLVAIGLLMIVYLSLWT
jgi:putative membrane protein